jgi:hypothetical protein
MLLDLGGPRYLHMLLLVVLVLPLCSAGEIRAEEVLCIQKLLVMIND